MRCFLFVCFLNCPKHIYFFININGVVLLYNKIMHFSPQANRFSQLTVTAQTFPTEDILTFNTGKV